MSGTAWAPLTGEVRKRVGSSAHEISPAGGPMLLLAADGGDGADDVS